MKKILILILLFQSISNLNAQVIFNEIQADAGNNEGTGGEWIELKNIGANTVDLSCWKISNGGSYKLLIPNGLLLQAGQHLLIGNASKMMCAACDFPGLNSQFALSPDGFGPGSGAYTNAVFLNTDVLANGGCDCMDGNGSLNNGASVGDRIVLFNDNGTPMDGFMYSGGNSYGTNAISLNFNGSIFCIPQSGIMLPATTDAIYQGRTICNDQLSCNSSYARIPDGNNGATVTWNQSGNLACSGCTNPCASGSLNTASTDEPTPGLDNSSVSWSATLNGNPVTTTNSIMTVCGTSPITFQYSIPNYMNVALTAAQPSGYLGSYVKIGTANPSNFNTATYNSSTGITTLSSTVTPPSGTTVYEFVWGDANSLCAVCPGTTSSTNANNIAVTAKECYVYHSVTVMREDPLGGSLAASCSIPGSVSVSGATGTNLKYELKKQSTSGGPFVTVAGPQNSNIFAGVIDDDADPALPNYQVVVTTVNTVCANSSLSVNVPNACLGNPACPIFETSGTGVPTFLPASSSSVCAGSAVQFSVGITGVCTGGQVEVLYDYNNAFDPYTQGTSLGIVNTTVGATPPVTTATGKVYISEFVPRPSNTGACAVDGTSPNSGEYVELYNAGPGNTDISGWMLTDGDWTATIPAGTILVANGYYLIGGGGTLCYTGVTPNLNVETCNCTGGTNSGGGDFMNLTNSAEWLGLYDCSNTFIDGVYWGSLGSQSTLPPASIAGGCGNYLISKTPVFPGTTTTVPATSQCENTGGGMSGSVGGRARDASGLWTISVNNLQFGLGYNGTAKAANGAFTMWNGGNTPLGSQCPAPPVNATISVNIPDTCSQVGNTAITLKAIYRPDPVSPCTASDVTATANYFIPACELVTLSGTGDYCVPNQAPLTLTSSSALMGNYDFNFTNGTNSASILGASGAGPFTTSVSNSGTWTVNSIVTPIGVCPPKVVDSAVVTINPIPNITASPASASACYLYGFDLATLQSQIVSSPAANTFEWYDVPSNGSPISSFVNPSSSTTYYVAPSSGPTAFCEGTRVPVTLNLNPLPLVPNVSCNGVSVTFAPQSPDCDPTPCASGLEYSANGINWSAGPTFTFTDPGWAGWGSPTTSLVYIRNASSPSCFQFVTYFGPCSTPLPAQLLKFDGVLNSSKTVDLFWTTANEKQVSKFEIERSNNGIHFVKIGTLVAEGNTSGETNYQFNDSKPNGGRNIYRLKMLDVDGQYTYSQHVQIDLNVQETTLKNMFPNPAQNSLNLEIESVGIENIEIQVTDLMGRVIKNIPFSLKAGFNQTQLDIQSLSKGTYTLRIGLKGNMLVKKFVKE